jgi:hypothetical protein
MMIKYAIENENGQIEQHLKILHFKQGYNDIDFKKAKKQYDKDHKDEEEVPKDAEDKEADKVEAAEENEEEGS